MDVCPEKIRAFVAIRVDREVHRAIEDLIDELRAPGDGVRWVSSANLHLTLKFLGPAVPIDQIRALEPELEALASETAAFELDASGVGAFPDLIRPRVLWVGLRSEALIDLARRIEDAAARCGFAREERPFNAHLTIGRVKAPRLTRRTRTALERVADRKFGASRIREMTLYRSTPSSSGPVYEALRVFTFSG